MANAIYPKWKTAIMELTANNKLSSGNVKVALVDTGTYTYDPAHQFLTSLSGITATSGNLANKTVGTLAGGVFDADNITFSAVTGAVSEALVIYIDTGVAATSPLVVYLDQNITNLPVTPNGGDITIAWSVSGIFSL